MAEASTLPSVVIEERTFISQVYGWMAVGLLLTGGMAVFLAGNPVLLTQIVGTKVLFYGLMIVELGLVIALAGWAQNMSSGAALACFLGYAALNGITFSMIFLVYTGASIASTFFVTAGTFGVMSLYGYTTKTDLTTMGNICFMGLIGIIIASLVNFFFKNAMVYWITTYLGVLVFVGLTAYDTQKIKNLNVAGDAEMEKKEAIVGALTLYLDFINLFLDLLRIMGKRRE